MLGLSLAVPVPMGTVTGVPTGRGEWVGVVGREELRGLSDWVLL